MKDEIDSAALAMLVENHWDEFVEYSGGEEDAEKTLRVLGAWRLRPDEQPEIIHVSVLQ